MLESKVHIVVGLDPGGDLTVLRQAAAFAERFQASLVCAVSEAGRYAIHEEPDGTVISVDIDPDQSEYERREIFDKELRSRVDAVLGPRAIEWTPRALAGDPAAQLAHLAEEVDAAMIIVGTRRPGRWASVREFLNGSIAAHLAHRQRRPVVVVPLDPVRDGEVLPWQGDS